MNEALPSTLDPSAGQRGAADPSASVWVAASAGTGKTKVLTDRVLSLMLAGTPPQRILCLTFTKAAAAEMTERIARELGRWAAVGDEDLKKQLIDLLGQDPNEEQLRLARRLFASVLDTPGGLNIQTIHAFCQSLLGRFPLEANVAPHFSVLDERDVQDLMVAARDEVLLAAGREGSPLAQALAEVTDHAHESTFAELMKALAAERGRLSRCIDRHGSVGAMVAATRALLGLGPEDTPASVVTEGCENRQIDIVGLRRAVAALAQGSDTDRERGKAIGSWLEAAPDHRAATFDAYTRLFLANMGKSVPPTVRKTLITKDAKAPPAVAEVLHGEADRLLAVEMKRRAAITATATAALLVIAEAMGKAYQRLKNQRALLDYDDLILAAGRLLEAPGNVSWVLYKLDGGIDHVLIDEAQDTSPEQWRIIRALTAEFFAGEGARETTRTVFAVGDVKQSIFSFQGADPDEFVANRTWFGERVAAAQENWRPIDLTVSFRSTRAVLAAVDAVFAQADAADGVALDGGDIVHQAHRKLDGGSVEIWPPVEPLETDPLPAWKPPIERIPGDSPQARLAQLLARRIETMTSGKEILESQGRPIRAGDIMVLVRRRTAFVEELVRALKLRGVAVAGVDRMVLTEQMAVMDLLAVGHFVLLPTDDLTLACVLKSPLIGLDDADLFSLAHGRGETSLWQSLAKHAANDPRFQDAHGQLQELLAMADMMAPFAFYARLLGALGGRRKLLARLGPEAEDPLGIFLDLARQFERDHVTSLQGFLHWIEIAPVEIKRDMEQGGELDAVRVMTVHGAKGLQAPIVFLPDTLQVPKQGARLLWPEIDGGDGSLLLWPPSRDACDAVANAESERFARKQRQEYRRLLYVAMTRASDRLIVCGWRTKNSEPADCWYHLVRKGLADAREAIGLQEVDDPFLAKAPEIGGCRVLRLTCPQEAPTTPKGAPAAIEAARLPPWVDRPAPIEPEPPRPLVPSRPDDDEPAVHSPVAAGGGDRFKRGRIIHRLLQSLPDVDPRRRPEIIRRWLARPVHGLDQTDQQEIAGEVLAVVEHPDFREIFGPGSLAEVPIAGVVGNRAIAGQVDRLLIATDAVTILDYKTDRLPPADPSLVPAAYLRQMAAYRQALQAIYPGRPVRCLLLWTAGPALMALDEASLDGYAP